MTKPALAMVLVAALLVLAAIMLRFRHEQAMSVVAKPLMSQRERAALGLLEAALPGCRIYAQVAMGALLQPQAGLTDRERFRMRGRFSQKIIDFVVEDRATGEIVALVELDDRSHSRARDQRRDAMTRAAGYRTLRLARPSRAEIARAVTNLAARDCSDPPHSTVARRQTVR